MRLCFFWVQSGADASEVIQQAEKNKQDAADKEKEVSDAYAKLKEKLVKVGNLVPDSVPVSNDEVCSYIMF